MDLMHMRASKWSPVSEDSTKETSIFEEGMAIVPPLQTTVGLVGLLICFDVGRRRTLKEIR